MASFLSPSYWRNRLLYVALLFAHAIHAADYGTICNGDVYGNPVSTDCVGVLARFPIHDQAVHYFVEQQLRTAPPQAVWNSFKDPRPPDEKQNIVQLPRRVSYGRCNVALFSFTHFSSKNQRLINSSPALAWSDVFSAGLQLDNECLTHEHGGAIVINDIHGQPGLSLFVWEDDAPFQFLLNHENILEFPPGMDPVNPDAGPSLLNNATVMMGLRAVDGGLTQDVSALYL